MFEGLAQNTGVITYLMAAAGILGIMAKIINQLTLHRLVKAAGNMPKSTHRLIKLVRAKYEHACMIRDSVENVDAFVEKYIYEYRGFLLRIHTWRQIEILSVWFAGILAALGASVLYFSSGFSESVYQYIAAGLAETILLAVIMRLTDEPYKIHALKMYMVDYLENICTFRLNRQNARERESIDVIAPEGSVRNAKHAEAADYGKRDRQEVRTAKRSLRGVRTPGETDQADDMANARDSMHAGVNPAAEPKAESGLPINIEGEPRYRNQETVPVKAAHSADDHSEERPPLREEAIRQILEEFLA